MTALREAGIAASFDTSGIKRGADQGKAELAALGAEAKRSARELESARRGLDRLAAQVDPAARATQRMTQFQNGLNRAVDKGVIDQARYNQLLAQAEAKYRTSSPLLGRLTGELRGFLGTMTLVGSAYAGLRFAGDALEEVGQKQTALAKLDTILRQTAGAAGLTRTQLVGLAEELHRTSNFTDDAALEAEALLLTYTRIHGDVFPRTVRATADLAERMGGDLPAAAEKLGRALEGQQNSLRGLRDQSISFSVAETKVIEQLFATGRAAAAQGLILDKLEGEIGGLAAAARDTLPGALATSKKAADDLKEAFGEGLAPAISESAGNLSELAANDEALQFLRDLGTVTGEVIVPLAKLVTILAADDIALIRRVKGLKEEIRETTVSALALQGRFALSGTGAGPVASPRERAAAEAEHARKAAEAARAQSEELRRQAEAEARKLELQKQAAQVAERQRKLLADQVAEANRLAQAWQLVAGGMKPELAERLLAAARALGKNNLLDPLVKSFAEIAEQVELTLLKLKNAPGNLQPIPFDASAALRDPDPGREAAEQRRLDMEQRWRELLNDTLSDEERRIAVIAEAQRLAAKLGKSEEELDRIRIHHADTIGVIQEEEERLATATAHASSALSYLAGELGGFFDHLAQLAQRLQGAQGFGGSVGGLAGSIPGVSAGAASAAGAAAGYLAIWYVVYDTIKQLSADSRTRRYGSSGEFEISGGQERLAGLGDHASKLGRAIRDVVESLEDALRISITDLGEIGVKVRNDGKHFKAYFEGLLLGKFSSLEEAIGAALTHAFRTGGVEALGLTDLMEQGLGSGLGNDVNELVESLAQLREIGDLGLTAAVIQAQETTRRLDDLWQALERLGEATPAVVEGFENLIASELRMWNDLFDGITGRQRTPAELMEQRRQELAIATAELAVRKAVIAQRILEIHATIAAIRAGRQLVGVGGGTPTGGGGDGGGGGTLIPIGDGIMGVTGAFATAGQALGVVAAGVVASSTLISATGNALSQGALDMLAALEAEADALQRLLDALPTPPGEDEIKPPRLGGGGGRRAQVRDWLDDNDFRLDNEALGTVQRQLAELNREYDEQAAALRRGSAELARLNEQREREADLIRRQGIDDAYGALRDLEGRSNPFTDLAAQADAAREKFDDLFESGAIGAERYAIALGRIDAAERERIRALSVEGYQTLLGSANEYLEDTEIAKELERARFEAVVATYEAEFELLRLRGDLTDAEAERLGIVLEALRGVDFDAWWANRQRRPDPPDQRGGAGRSDDPAADLAALLKEARDLLNGYRDDRRHPIDLRLRKIDEDFTKIFRTLGTGAETMEEYRLALRRVDEEMKESIRDVLAALDDAEFAPTTGDQRLRQAEARARDLATRARGGDYQAFEDVAAAIQDWVSEAQAYAPSSPYFYSVFEEANRLLRELLSLRLFAGGGVSSGPAIFGERGPEAAVPLPDGRTIPVTLTAGGLRPVVAAVDRSGLASAQALARILAAIERLEAGQSQLRTEQERTRGALDRHVALAGSLARR